MEKIYRLSRLLLLLVLIAAISFGCKQLGFEDEDDDESPSAVEDADINGYWAMSFDGQMYDVFYFYQSGSSITMRDECQLQDIGSGSVAGNQFNVTSTNGFSMTGTISDSSMSGTFDTSDGTGNWTATKSDRTYCSTHQVPDAVITVDGVCSEWSSNELANTDDVDDLNTGGNASGFDTGADIKQIYAAKNGDTVYFALVTIDGQTSTNLDYRFRLDLNSNGEKDPGEMTIGMDSATSLRAYDSNTKVDNATVLAATSGAAANCVEISTSISTLGSPTSMVLKIYTRVNGLNNSDKDWSSTKLQL
ncbi:MAG: hypothetical protein GY866_16950 [Proteobacteria bacterium]|nr:hypothetical protein [Pseudomonadota bacterium]